MPDGLDNVPFWMQYLFFLVVVLGRAQATYWVARVVTEQALRHTLPTTGAKLRVHAWLQGEGTQRGVEILRRRGVWVIPFSFLTVGFQTMVNAAAGVIRMTWPRYTAAMVPGAMAWAAIYSLGMWAAWESIVAAATGSWWGVVGLIGVLLAIVALIVLRRRRGARLEEMLLGRVS
ncbi:MAG: hypothetical protein JJE50_03040 [Actinomycetales bacterium]|nr:hypothetical protein [Actinomycetales bacterium]